MFEWVTPAAELNAEGPVDPAFDPEWVYRRVSPDDPTYLAYLAYEDQQIAFWNAYSAGPAGTIPSSGSASSPSSDRESDLLLGLGPNLNDARTDSGLLGEISRQARRANACEGAKLRAIADYANRRMSAPVVGYDQEYLRRSVEAEVGCELGISPSAASRLLEVALNLARRLPQTFAALERGELTRSSAELICDEATNLDVAQCAQLETELVCDEALPDTAARSYRSLRTKVQRAVKKLDADAVRKRAEKAREDRCVYLKPGQDDMTTLCIVLPADVAQATFDALTDRVYADRAAARIAHQDAALVVAARDERRLGAQRCDLVVDILAAALGVDLWAPKAAEFSFLTEEQIAALDQHAGTYRPSTAMKRAIRNRDKHCRFPGCRRPARHCDVDHTVAFQVGGRTVYYNLGCVCRFHHQIKQLPGWHLTQDRGRFIWTTPTGIRFFVHPPPDDNSAEPADFHRVDPGEDIPF